MFFKCFTYGKEGQISKDCEQKKVNNTENEESVGHIDDRKVNINGIENIVILDTGASHSIISDESLNRIGKIELKPDVKEFRFFDGPKRKTISTVELDVKYEGKNYNNEFNVVRGKNKNILLSNRFVKQDGRTRRRKFQLDVA